MNRTSRHLTTRSSDKCLGYDAFTTRPRKSNILSYCSSSVTRSALSSVTRSALYRRSYEGQRRLRHCKDREWHSIISSSLSSSRVLSSTSSIRNRIRNFVLKLILDWLACRSVSYRIQTFWCHGKDDDDQLLGQRLFTINNIRNQVRLARSRKRFALSSILCRSSRSESHIVYNLQDLSFALD